MSGPSYHVFVSDRGNIFMTEIAGLLAAALTDLGYDVLFPAPDLPERRDDRINLVVAPHEFFPLQRGRADTDLLRAAEASAVVCVEQPGTTWFDLGAHYAAVAGAVLDISPYAVEVLRARGIHADHLKLGYHPSWDCWGGDPDHPRDTDLLFLGSVTTRRERLLASVAPLLWDCRADIRLFEFPRPMTEPRGHFVAGIDKWNLLTASRTLLNIHRDEVPYLEWVRILEAVINGCLVITECSSSYGPLQPGKHLVAAPARLLGAYVSSLLCDETLRTEMTASAYDLVRTEFRMTELLGPVCAELEKRTHRAAPPKRAVTPLPAASTSAPSPAPPAALRDALESHLRVRVRVKELLDSETELVRQIEALEARRRFGDAAHTDVAATRGWATSTPEISVVVPLYNYEGFVEEAMGSVVASMGVAPELVVIDDHSADRSATVARRFMANHEWFPIKLLARSANAGVSAARNLGIAAARGSRILMLDADNFVHPTALAKLSASLDQNEDAAFSYGILACSDDCGLLSQFPWDVERLCRANYVDGLALIRRTVLDELGGYDGHFGVGGWEDYELWLRFAAAGYSGAFVREFVGVYRVHGGSRQTTVNLDVRPLRGELRRRYSFLPWAGAMADDGVGGGY